LHSNKLKKDGSKTSEELTKLTSLLYIHLSSKDLYEYGASKIFEKYNSKVDEHNYPLYMGAYVLSELNYTQDAGLPCLPKDITNIIMGALYEHHIEFGDDNTLTLVPDYY